AAAGPQIRARAELFVDQKMVLRQSICPTCYVVLLTEIVPEDEPERRNRKVQWDASQPTRARGPDHDGSGPD
ncbi:MAG: hypothetical protein QF609_04110, partial [Gammaproteobacteria bacterium]|nr:hypothetical protein [Gammaproteobacteria bacterium]